MSGHLSLDAESLYQTLCKGVGALLTPTSRLVGITSGGAWLATRLQKDLHLSGEAGSISSAMHRDDFAKRGLADGGQTKLPFEVNGAHVIVLDDVLYTGRTIRAVLNELFDYGRPASVQLAVLVDRGGRELPVQADFAAARIALPADQLLALANQGNGAGGFLFGKAARTPLAAVFQTQRRHLALDLEGLSMGLAARGADAITRHRQSTRLQQFLQLGLGVLGPAADVGGVDHIAEQPLHQRTRGGKSTIDERRSDERLERIGQDRCTLGPAATRLALAEPQCLWETVTQRHLVQAVLAHEVGANAGQIALVAAGKPLEQETGHRQAQHRVAQEFKPLVVIGAEAAVCDGQRQQRRICKRVPQVSLQRLNARIHGGAIGTAGHALGRQGERPSYLMSRNTGLITSISLS